ncbi:uncharacterized protein LOC143301595 [Babylonia areolata]|uniref:uncharacterized protein LOC143301595 n=1 Tax=Babylonia areolata TaxID=304850 RepID=UPI003FD3AFFB
MMPRACWLAVVVWFVAVGANDLNHGYDAKSGENRLHKPTCLQLCAELNIKDGCQRAPQESVREEVIIMTNGSATIQSWKWDTITMVVTTYFDGISKTSLTSCVAHSKGKRYGLREYVPGSYDITTILGDVEAIKKDFISKITEYQRQTMADHMVFDLLLFFHQLEKLPSKSVAIAKMSDILSAAASKIRENHDSEVFCVVPWEPPCPETNCTEIRMLLGYCHVLLLSPDSYMPKPEPDGNCKAQATVPISKFLYD